MKSIRLEVFSGEGGLVVCRVRFSFFVFMGWMVDFERWV